MNPKESRRKFSDDFKLRAVQLVLGDKLRKADVARQLGLTPKMVDRWVGEYRNREGWARSEAQQKKEDENRRLRRENLRLRQENEILKKAGAYFAKESTR